MPHTVKVRTVHLGSVRRGAPAPAPRVRAAGPHLPAPSLSVASRRHQPHQKKSPNQAANPQPPNQPKPTSTTKKPKKRNLKNKKTNGKPTDITQRYQPMPMLREHPPDVLPQHGLLSLQPKHVWPMVDPRRALELDVATSIFPITCKELVKSLVGIALESRRICSALVNLSAVHRHLRAVAGAALHTTAALHNLHLALRAIERPDTRTEEGVPP